MSVFKRRLMISAASMIMMIFLCYGAYPRTSVPVSSQPRQQVTLVIDPGHGGIDGGAVSVSNVRESDLNLQIGLRLDDLSALVGLHSVMTRQTDISLHDEDSKTIAQKKASDLRKRVELANAVESAVLLSIHQNHFPQGKYHGAQVFYSRDSRSTALAQEIQNDLRDSLNPYNKRKAKTSQGVYLMQHVSCPAVLVECGFLSNAKELHNLQTDTYQKKLAVSVLRSIAQKGNGVFESEI